MAIWRANVLDFGNYLASQQQNAGPDNQGKHLPKNHLQQFTAFLFFTYLGRELD